MGKPEKAAAKSMTACWCGYEEGAEGVPRLPVIHGDELTWAHIMSRWLEALERRVQELEGKG